MNQHEFVESCEEKYLSQSLPPRERWENAHYPRPQCLGGKSTKQLWGRDHSLQGVLQSEDFNHPCIHHAAESRDRQNICLHYPEYLPLYEKWLRKLKSLGGKTCINKLDGRIPTPNGNPSHLDGGNLKKVHERRKKDSGFNDYIVSQCRLNASKGGKVGGPLNKGKRWCNNGLLEKRYTELNGIPDGFKPGRLVKKDGKPVNENG